MESKTQRKRRARQQPYAEARDATPRPIVVPASPLLTGPIVPTLLRFALPNVFAMTAAAAVTIAETFYIGRLGTEPLAAMALVFPLIMLTQMMSSGAMGGGVSSAVSRALGARDEARARSLAVHALVIGVAGGVLFSATFLIASPMLFPAIGARGGVLAETLSYAGTFFAGASALWLFNTASAIVRGAGNMTIPSAVTVAVCAIQIVLGGALCLGLAGLPRLGLAGAALGQIGAYAAGALALILYLRSRHARVRLDFAGITLQRGLFRDILKVGAVACVSSILAVLSIVVMGRFIAGLGPAVLAGYGIGTRLEFLLIPIAFAIGVAAVPLVGMAIGAGDVARARRIAWTGGLLAGATVGAIGLLGWVWPEAWAGVFTTDPAVIAATRDFLHAAAPAFGLLGLGSCLYFASQGSGRMLGPVLAQALRVAVIITGGGVLARNDAGAKAYFILIGIGMAVHGLGNALALALTRWERG